MERFSPGHGACVMGTGILAIATHVYLWPPLRHPLALFFTLLNTVIAAVVAAMLLLK